MNLMSSPDDTSRRGASRKAVHGIHHVTCISGDAQENLDFFTGPLGLRLVKRTVNQDAPDTYHLFYADGEGRAGTDMTFFPWPAMRPGQEGTGLAMEVGFAIPEGSLGFWAERLASAGVSVGGPDRRFGRDVLSFTDPHGLALTLTESEAPLDTAPWHRSPVPEEHQIRGFQGVRLWEQSLSASGSFLVDVLGFEEVAEEDGWHRFGAGGGGSSRWVEIRELPEERRGTWGPGAVHHVAFRVTDDEEELAVRQQVSSAGIEPTPVIDRFWFRSVYFREPGGVLYELATEGPGFTADEALESLGESLILPPWLEDQRGEIEAVLPPLEGPAE